MWKNNQSERKSSSVSSRAGRDEIAMMMMSDVRGNSHPNTAHDGDEREKEKSTTTNIWHSQTEWISFSYHHRCYRQIYSFRPSAPQHTDKRQLCPPYDDDEQQRWSQFWPNQPNLQSSTSDKHKPNDENWKSNEFLCVKRASWGECQKSEKHKRENPQTEDENGWGNCLHLFSLLNFHFIYIYISTSHTHVCSVEWSERVKGKSL